MPSLRSQLIRLAQENPDLRGDLLPILALDRTAMNPATQDFIEWAVNQERAMTSAEVMKAVKSLGVTIQGKKTRRKGMRFQVGDQVQVVPEKHRDRGTIEMYEKFRHQVGKVVAPEGKKGGSVFVQIGGSKIEFPEAQKGRNVGLRAYRPAYEMKGYGPVEIIYFAGGKSTDEAKVTVQQYVDRGTDRSRTEMRSPNYYTGYVYSAYSQGRNGPYFTMASQQRVKIDPNDANFNFGNMFRSMNPDLGRVMYFGKFPSGRGTKWKKELEAMRAEAEQAETLVASDHEGDRNLVIGEHNLSWDDLFGPDGS